MQGTLSIIRILPVKLHNRVIYFCCLVYDMKYLSCECDK